MHKRICSSNSFLVLAGVRLSFSQYGRAWEEDRTNADLEEYKKDITNFLKIYWKYYNYFGSGFRKMCVEIRYNTLVEISNVIVTNYKNHMVVATGNYLFISDDNNIKLNESHITNPYKHSLELSEEPNIFSEYQLDKDINNEKDLIYYIDNNELIFKRKLDLYLFCNRDGIYYSFNPKISNTGNYGFNIYPITDKRKKSGYLITERFLLNSIYEFKRRRGLNLRSIYKNSTWDDVYEVLDICKNIGTEYLKENKKDKYNYINEHILPLVTTYVDSLKEAKYSSDCFFDSKFTIDTGTICNLGRAINLFKGITSYINEPITPTHERNYGRYCSTMKQENYVWKLGAGFDDTLVIEKLDLFNTATQKGQTSYRNVLKFENINEKKSDNKNEYLYPGVKE